MMFDPILIFIAVAEHKSFSKAAEQLNITQPAVSQNIKNLEEFYGARLLDRTRKSVALTYPGEVFLGYARQMVNLHKESVKAVKDASLKNTPLTIGASMTVGEYVLPHVMALCKRQDASIELKVRIGNTKEMIALLVNEEIDVALVEGEVNVAGLVIEPFLDDELVLVVSSDHPLGNQNTVTVEHLKEQTFIVREQGSGTRKLAEDTLIQQGIELAGDKIIEIGSTQAIKEFTEKGLGIAVVSISTVQKEVAQERLKALRIEGCRMIRQFRWVTKPSRYETFSMARFKGMLFAMES
jgi:DNA-binding transcriptional LysR family regulator